MSSGAFIAAAKRTPFGAFGGSLRSLSANELGGLAAKTVINDLPKSFQGKIREQAELPAISSVIFGNVAQTSKDAMYLARHVGHRAGLPVNTPALTINRLCGSGFQSIINAVQEIKAGDSEVVLTGGSENMSQAPYVLRDVRWGTKFGLEYLKMEDSLACALTDQYPSPIPMAITAEKLGEKYSITREMCDEFALKSQQRWVEANSQDVFRDEITPIEIQVKKKGKGTVTQLMTVDEYPRPGTTIEALRALKPVFKADGMVTAGNASGINDGAGAAIIASEAACSKHGFEPLSRIVSYHVVGVEPSLMGIGPADAIRGALKKAGLTLDDMDLVEVNEAFAAQYLAVEKELGLDPARTNVCGGAIAIGHPLAASGSRIMAHLAHRLVATRKRFAVGSACIGGGQGIAIVIENMKL
ncbi:3-ketoacyl-CoA thiolase, mitochondrial [Spiromyces aspiralis]|uniref:3-ketoacyl-CoA thiolase, mitochondrial n=1 Tax=Spiromyces aspiralis TaxID=68401 RepID=A0ACC1HQ12_9FUNG|nr:3-ketoacyl-CoA thiolase, mitochondrial [Spiromyces aspiralis]